MNHSGDAAEQIVRMSLEGIEVAARITGTAAKEIATFLVAALKSNNSKLKLKGKARMTSMLKSGKALEIFSVKESDLQKFMQGAKQYGIVYCVLRNKKRDMDGMCDIMVKADDAPKISRLVERFKFATVDKAKIESEIVKSRDGKRLMMDEITGEQKVMDVISVKEGHSKQLINEFKKSGIDYLDLKDGKSDKNAIADFMVQSKDRERVDDILAKLNIENLALQSKDGEKSTPDRNDTEKLLDDLLGTNEGKASPEKQPEPDKPDVAKTTPVKEAPVNPAKAKTINSLPSEPTSESRSKSAKGTSSKPSVKGEIRDIRAARQAKEEAGTPKRDEKSVVDKPKSQATTHKQPQNGGKQKSKKSKER